MSDLFARLVAFMDTRLDEDEAVALACLDINERVKIRRGLTPSRWLTSPDSSNITDEAGILRVRHTWKREGEHIASHDPARTLREVEAKRAIIRRCAAVMNEMDVYPNGLVSPRALLARQSLMWLGAIWSDHADYDQEWKP